MISGIPFVANIIYHSILRQNCSNLKQKLKAHFLAVLNCLEQYFNKLVVTFDSTIQRVLELCDKQWEFKNSKTTMVKQANNLNIIELTNEQCLYVDVCLIGNY